MSLGPALGAMGKALKAGTKRPEIPATEGTAPTGLLAPGLAQGAAMAAQGAIAYDQNRIAGEFGETEPQFKEWHKYAGMDRPTRLTALRHDVKNGIYERAEKEAARRDQEFLTKFLSDLAVEEARAEELGQSLYNQLGDQPLPPERKAATPNLGELVAGFATGLADGFEQGNRVALGLAGERNQMEFANAESAYQFRLKADAARYGLDLGRYEQMLQKVGAKQQFIQAFETRQLEKKEAFRFRQAEEQVDWAQQNAKVHAEREFLMTLGIPEEKIAELLTAKYERILVDNGYRAAKTQSELEKVRLMPEHLKLKREELRLRGMNYKRQADYQQWRKGFDAKKFVADENYRRLNFKLAYDRIAAAAQNLGLQIDAGMMRTLAENELRIAAGDEASMQGLQTRHAGLQKQAQYIEQQLEALGEDGDKDTVAALQQQLLLTEMELAQVGGGLSEISGKMFDVTGASITPGEGFLPTIKIEKERKPSKGAQIYTEWKNKFRSMFKGTTIGQYSDKPRKQRGMEGGSEKDSRHNDGRALDVEYTDDADKAAKIDYAIKLGATMIIDYAGQRIWKNGKWTKNTKLQKGYKHLHVE